MEPIICAIDETTSDTVAPTAGELARLLDMRLLLVHVVADPPLFNSKAERERDRNRATRRGMALLRRAGEALPDGIEWDEIVELGDPVATLSKLAEDTDASLLVVGSRGRGAFASALLGSVSRALAADAPCPVGVVPADQSDSCHLIVGVGDSERSVRVAALADELADRIGGRLVLSMERP